MYGQLRHSDIFSMSVTSYLNIINVQREKKGVSRNAVIVCVYWCEIRVTFLDSFLFT